MEFGSWWRRGGLVVLALFLAIGLIRFPSGASEDLSASYIGCRLLAAGQGEHLYRHDPVDFSAIGPDDPWQAQADAGGFLGMLHPYVQTPLWAYGLQPLCTRTSFAGFDRVFAWVAVLCFALSVGLIAWFWTPALWNPLGMTVVLAGLWWSVPFRYAMSLMQTHVVFFAMTIGALILSERRRPGWAGFLLAGAAAVKLTPAVLVVYWVITRRWRAAVWMGVWSGAIFGLTVLAVGRGLVVQYIAEVHRISGILLVAENNQSLAAWWMARFYPSIAATQMTMHTLPAAMKAISLGLMLVVTAIGGWIDRRRGVGRAPMGAMIALVAATVFAPIAWTHYSIVLVAPLMVLWQESVQERRWAIWIAMAGIFLLNFRPLAADVTQWVIGRHALLRSEFYAGVICLGVLGWVGWREQVRVQEVPARERMEMAA